MQEKLDMPDEGAFRAGTALAGGVARMGDTCGALTGAVMSVGQVMGRSRIEDKEQSMRAMAPAQEIYRRFREAVGPTKCTEIHEVLYGRSFVLTDPVDYQAFLDAGGHTPEGCPGVCAKAARIAADVLIDLREGNP